METPAAPPFPPQPAQSKTSGLALTSLVLGILSLVCFGVYGTLPAVICGTVALNKIAKSGGLLTGNGPAIAGIVTGGLPMVFICLSAKDETVPSYELLDLTRLPADAEETEVVVREVAGNHPGGTGAGIFRWPCRNGEGILMLVR